MPMKMGLSDIGDGRFCGEEEDTLIYLASDPKKKMLWLGGRQSGGVGQI